MELATKGAEAPLEASFEQLLVKLQWTTAADFDIGALFKRKDGSDGLIYFGNKGKLSETPFMSLDKDAGVGDTGGTNEETLRIAKLEGIEAIHLLAWDYGSVQKGEKARFGDSDVKLTVLDDKGNSHDTRLDTGDTANVAVLATIDNTSPIGPKLINTSKVGTLKGFNNTTQLWEIVNAS